VTVTRSLVMSSKRHSRRTRATGPPGHERVCHAHPDPGMLTVAASADVGCTWRAQSGPWAAVAYGDDAAVARHAMNRLIWLADLSVPMFPVMVQIRDLRARLRGRQAGLTPGCSPPAFPLDDPAGSCQTAGTQTSGYRFSGCSCCRRGEQPGFDGEPGLARLSGKPAEGEGSHGS
jgi:hypothetical protein